MHRTHRPLAAAGAVIVFLLFGVASAQAVDIQGITWSTHAEFSRVTIEISAKAKPLVVRLPADPEKGKPERLAIDFAGGELAMGGPSRIDVRDGRIDTIRFGKNDGGVRIVLDLPRAARHRGLRQPGPMRIEIDVFGPAGAAATP